MQKSKFTLLNIYFLFLTCLGCLGMIYSDALGATEAAKIFAFFWLMTFLMFSVGKIVFPSMLAESKDFNILVFGYTISFLLIMFSTKINIYHLWLFGIVLIAAMVSRYMGLGIHFIFTFLYCGLHGSSMMDYALIFTLGCVMCALCHLMESPTTYAYVMTIIVSLNIALVYIINDFKFTATLGYNIIYSVIVVTAIYIILKATGKTVATQAIENVVDSIEKSEEAERNSNQNTTNIIKITPEPLPVEETPVEETPAKETPVEETLVEETPVEETLIEETLVEENFYEETSFDDDASDEDTSIEKTSEGLAPEQTSDNEITFDSFSFKNVADEVTATSPGIMPKN
ncbi:MAG: hypothetical protein K6G65_09420, partial [Lachnospiraceae bacterium]|nr:hypothetical protein [Lachnospiraceae bacterium]